MKYEIDAATSIFFISERLIQVSNCLHSFTFEDENANFTKIITLIKSASDIEKNISHAELENSIAPLLEVLLEYGFIRKSVPSYTDLAQLHLELMKESSAELPFAKHIFSQQDPIVTVVDTGLLSQRVATELKNLGYKVHLLPAGADLPNYPIICCTDTEDHQLFEAINQQAANARTCCLFATLSDSVLKVGPFFVPEQTACFRCYTHRCMPSTVFIEEYIAKKSAQAYLHRATGAVGLYSLAAAYFVISQMLRLFHGNFHLCLFNEILELDLIDYRQTIRPVMKVANCEHCHSHHIQAVHRLTRHKL